MESSLPYQIPGPAGGISRQPQTRAATPPKPMLDLFQTTPWRNMLVHLKRKIPSSIALLRRNALSNDFVKLNSLPVLIDSLTHVGKDASVLLRDPTGYVRGTIHAEVFKERKDMLERGVVILLNGVSALAYLEESRGFRAGEDAVHLSVQACHVSEVFKSRDTLSATPALGTLLDDYEPQAKCPKPVVKPFRTRPPLRERNYPRPPSRGYLPAREVAASRGRGQHSYTSPQSRPPAQHRIHQHHPHYRHQRIQPQHNPNIPPYHPSMSHQRPMLGSNQHKRPFRPPQFRSNNMTTGMAPPQKRPNLQSMQRTHDQARQQSCAVVTIADEQLDSLLGDLDVDAMIAAHEKSTSPPGQSAVSHIGKDPREKGNSETSPGATNKERQAASEPSPVASHVDSSNPFVAMSRASGESAIAKSAATRANSGCAGDGQDHAVVNNPPSWTSNQTPSAETPPQESARQDANHRIMESVNLDMVNSLLDGLDTNEFM